MFAAAGSVGKTGNMLLLVQLVSCDYDIPARKKYAAACGQEQAGSWKWKAHAPFAKVSSHSL